MEQHIESLDVEQRQFPEFIKSWLQSGRPSTVLLLTGGPGSGKSHTVFSTLKFYEDTLDIEFLAYTNLVARTIGGRTIHSRLGLNFKSREPHSIEEVWERMQDDERVLDKRQYAEACEEVANELVFHSCSRALGGKKDIICVDEAGMIPSFLAHAIVCFYQSCGLFVFIGDRFQLRPVKSKYNIFDINSIPLPTKTISLLCNNRFTEEYHHIIKLLRKAVADEDVDGVFELLRAYYPIRRNIREDEISNVRMILAFKNETVDRYNRLFLSRLDGKLLKIPTILNGKVVSRNSIFVKPGCHLTLTESQGSKRKGTECVFSAYVPQKDYIVFRDGSTLRRSTNTGNFPVALTYASTIHKFQGQTLDLSKVVFQFDESTDLNLIYTALSRIRDVKQVYAVIL